MDFDRPAPSVPTAGNVPTRLKLQGSAAPVVIEMMLEGLVPPVRISNLTTFPVASQAVRVLRHGMVGQPGFGMFGLWDEK